MKTRAEVATEYDIDAQGTIRNPGRFEGEPWWIVNVEEWSMDGGGEDLSGFDDTGSGEYASMFEDLTIDETSAFGLDASTMAILYTVSEQGFHSVQELSASEAEKVRDDAAADNFESEDA